MRSDPTNKSDSKIPLDDLLSSLVSESDQLRSWYMQCLLYKEISFTSQITTSALPRILVQFWDDAKAVPPDVRECLNSWHQLDNYGFERLLFDDKSAAQFIAQHLDSRYLEAFKRCRHPAMRSDYFRLCFISRIGGFYVDADDVYQGGNLEHWFNDSRLKLQPLCYNSLTNLMISVPDLIENPCNLPELIFYVNNNPIIAPPNHPVIGMALERSTEILLTQVIDDIQDIQSTTGPGNLTACLVRHSIKTEHAMRSRDFALLADWDTMAISRWPLDYRQDKRNWRLWNGRDT